MRITGNRLIDVSAAATSKNQSAVADASQQATTGLRVQTASDDPSAWLAAQRTKLRQAFSQGTGAAVAQTRDRLELTDNALGSLGDVVSQVRTLAIQASSDTYNADNRAGLGAQVAGLFQSALDNANVRGNDGEYLLAGAAGLTVPFDAAGVYRGDASTRSVPTGDAITSGTSIAGTALTAAAPGGVDVLPLLGKVADALKTNDLPTLLSTLPDLDKAVKQVSLARTTAGGAMNALDATTSARTQLEDHMTQAISKLVEVDTVEAASNLAKASQSLEVSRAVTSHILAILDPAR